jgi:hypothetical protein
MAGRAPVSAVLVPRCDRAAPALPAPGPLLPFAATLPVATSA